MRLKSKMLLAFVNLIAVSMLVISPVSAENVVYHASEKLEEYPGAWSSEVINGYWNIIVVESDVGLEVAFFEAFYRKLNVYDKIEGSPNGTIDTFRLTLIDYVLVDIIDDECTISEANIHVKKKHWNLTTGLSEPCEWVWVNSNVTIDGFGILIDLPFVAGQEWDISGSTLSIYY